MLYSMWLVWACFCFFYFVSHFGLYSFPCYVIRFCLIVRKSDFFVDLFVRIRFYLHKMVIKKYKFAVACARHRYFCEVLIYPGHNGHLHCFIFCRCNTNNFNIESEIEANDGGIDFDKRDVNRILCIAACLH